MTTPFPHSRRHCALELAVLFTMVEIAPLLILNTQDSGFCVPFAGCYNQRMRPNNPKSVRRRLLTIFYEHYLKDPLEMLTPEDVLEDQTVQREDLLANIHYLSDRGLIELMLGYSPPMFAAARITADGIDLIEDQFEFNLRFPPVPGEMEEAMAGVPILMEQLVAEADFAALDGEKRKCLLRDVQYLRDELARPAERWRSHVVQTIISWIEEHLNGSGEMLPSLNELKDAVRARRE